MEVYHEAFKKQYVYMLDNLQVDTGLLNELREQDVISDREYTEIKTKLKTTSHHDACELLLDQMARKTDNEHRAFLMILDRGTKQSNDRKKVAQIVQKEIGNIRHRFPVEDDAISQTSECSNVTLSSCLEYEKPAIVAEQQRSHYELTVNLGPSHPTSVQNEVRTSHLWVEPSMSALDAKPQNIKVKPLDSYRSIFETKKKRIIVLGNTGYGKTELLKRLTSDWLSREPYIAKRFDLLFKLDLQSLTHEDNISTAIMKNKIIEECNFESDYSLDSLLQRDKTLILIDGSSCALMHNTLNQHMERLIKNEMLRKCTVVLTKTPTCYYHNEYPQKGLDFHLLRLDGFCISSMKKYVNQYFDSSEESHTVLEYITVNKLWQFCECPLALFYVVSLWQENDGINIPFTEFYASFLRCHVRRYCAKQGVSTISGEEDEVRDALSKCYLPKNEEANIDITLVLDNMYKALSKVAHSMYNTGKDKVTLDEYKQYVIEDIAYALGLISARKLVCNKTYYIVEFCIPLLQEYLLALYHAKQPIQNVQKVAPGLCRKMLSIQENENTRYTEFHLRLLQFMVGLSFEAARVFLKENQHLIYDYYKGMIKANFRDQNIQNISTQFLAWEQIDMLLLDECFAIHGTIPKEKNVMVVSNELAQNALAKDCDPVVLKVLFLLETQYSPDGSIPNSVEALHLVNTTTDSIWRKGSPGRNHMLDSLSRIYVHNCKVENSQVCPTYTGSVVTQLEIISTNFTQELFLQMCNAFCVNKSEPNLKLFWFQKCVAAFTQKMVGSLEKMLQLQSKVEVLDLSGNSMEGHLRGLNSFFQLKNLQLLSLASTYLNKADINVLVKGVKNMESLITLDLSFVDVSSQQREKLKSYSISVKGSCTKRGNAKSLLLCFSGNYLC